MYNTLLELTPPTASHILESIGEAVFVLSRQGTLVGSNAQGRNILAGTYKNAQKLTDFLYAELALEDICAKNDATPIQLRKIPLGDRTYMVRATFSGKHLVLMLSDITDLKHMARDMSVHLTQLLRLNLVLHSCPHPLVVADAFERILLKNKAMLDLLATHNAPTTQASLSELEAVFGHMPTTENPLCFFEKKDGTGGLLRMERQPLLLHGEKLHGFLLRFLPQGTAPAAAVEGQAVRQPGQTHWAWAQGMERAENTLESPGSSAPTVRPSRTVRNNSAGSYSLSDFVGQSKAILHIKEIVKKVAPSSSTVLLQSESGTGKELLARALHELSGRAAGPFIKLNCASLPESLLEAEVFGYDSGAFTGAKKSGNPGLFEQAHTGTIFLDELGEMSLPLQAKMLRIIQEREVQRLGGQDLKRLDVRVVCATNRNLLHMVEQGKFRSDLLFRLNVVSIAIPPLRNRKEDIKSLIIHFIREYSLHFKKNVSGISKEVYYLFMNYDWPGNIRELGNILEYAFNIIDGNIIEREHLPQYILDAPRTEGARHASDSLDNLVAAFSRQVILNALDQHDGNKAAAADALGISRSKLYRLIAEAGQKQGRP